MKFPTSKIVTLPPALVKPCPFCGRVEERAYDDRCGEGTDATLHLCTCDGVAIYCNGIVRKASVEEVKRHSQYELMKQRAEFYLRDAWG